MMSTRSVVAYASEVKLGSVFWIHNSFLFNFIWLAGGVREVKTDAERVDVSESLEVIPQPAWTC